ncbi:hypothetical protein GCM10027400_16450 [Pseudoxanthomonas daejeonensis]
MGVTGGRSATDGSTVAWLAAAQPNSSSNKGKRERRRRAAVEGSGMASGLVSEEVRRTGTGVDYRCHPAMANHPRTIRL